MANEEAPEVKEIEEATKLVEEGKNLIIDTWQNNTQIISLFIKKGSHGNIITGFLVQDDRGNEVTFVPSYDQIIDFLGALGTWQSKVNVIDEDFWLATILNSQ